MEVPGTNAHYFRLDEFDSRDGKDILYYGYNYLESGKDIERRTMDTGEASI